MALAAAMYLPLMQQRFAISASAGTSFTSTTMAHAAREMRGGTLETASMGGKVGLWAKREYRKLADYPCAEAEQGRPVRRTAGIPTRQPLR